MSSHTTEVQALAAIDQALTGLEDPEARERVLRWAIAKFGGSQTSQPVSTPAAPSAITGTVAGQTGEVSSISGPASLWLRRNGISNDQALGMIFSVDQQELDVIATDVPGSNMKARMRSVLLLRGACSFLRSGDFKFSDEEARATCRHYNVYNKNRFASYLSDMQDEISGARDGVYSLTPKGQKAAADLIKSMTSSLIW